MRARAYGLSGGIRHPLRNGFTAYAVLSPATNSSCHRRRRSLRLLNPVGFELATADLAPATGVRTTRFCRTLKRRSSCTPVIAHEVQPALRPPLRADALASTTSHPAFVTTRDRPSSWNGMAAVKPLIWGLREAQYCPSCQSAAIRRAVAYCRETAKESIADFNAAQLSDIAPGNVKVVVILTDGRWAYSRADHKRTATAISEHSHAGASSSAYQQRRNLCRSRDQSTAQSSCTCSKPHHISTGPLPTGGTVHASKST